MQRARPRVHLRVRIRAFTLIEVLVALAIVSIGMLVVIQAVSQTAENSAYLRDKTIAHWVAMNQLTAMRLSQTPPAKGSSGGEVEMGGQRWHWTAEVAQTAIASVSRIDVAVRAAEADDKSQMAIVTGFTGEKIAKPGTIIAAYSGPIVVPGSTVTVGTPPVQPTTPVPPLIPQPGPQTKPPQ